MRNNIYIVIDDKVFDLSKVIYQLEKIFKYIADERLILKVIIYQSNNVIESSYDKYFKNISVTIKVKPTILNESKLIYIVSNDTSQCDYLNFMKSGYCLINIDERLGFVDYSDCIYGYLLCQHAEFYSKIFNDEKIITNSKNIKQRLGSTINPRAIMLTQGVDGVGGNLEVGRGSHVGADSLFNLGMANFSMGNFSMISANVKVHGMRHALNNISSYHVGKGPFKFLGNLCDKYADINVGHDVWIGEGVTLLPGVKIGSGAVVGSASVVTKNIEAYTINAGNPCRFIKKRFTSNIANLLSDSEWWLWDYRKLYKKRKIFNENLLLFDEAIIADLF